MRAPITTEPCGCTHNGTHWLKMCPTCLAEQAAHTLAMRQHWRKSCTLDEPADDWLEPASPTNLAAVQPPAASPTELREGTP